MTDFWLVQRMKKNIWHKGPITGPEHLLPDYMGAAEFEWGALPKGLKAMRAAKLETSTVNINSYGTETTFHVVAPTDQTESLQRRFQEWAHRDFRSCENPYLEQVITRKGYNGKEMSPEAFGRLPIAWWALEERIFFSTNESVARMWLNDMQAPPETT